MKFDAYKLKQGDKVTYGFSDNLTFLYREGVNAVLKDKNGLNRKIYLSLLQEFGEYGSEQK